MKLNNPAVKIETSGSNISCRANLVNDLKYESLKNTRDHILIAGGVSKNFINRSAAFILPETKETEEKIKFVTYHNENPPHTASNVCSCEQCFVKWNNDEISWDCPCHGNRFSMNGEIINNPGNVDLPFYNQSTK